MREIGLVDESESKFDDKCVRGIDASCYIRYDGMLGKG